MKKLIKRIVPILLSVFMLFGVLDMPVYASSTDKEEEEPATELPDPDENSDGDNTEEEGSQDLSGKDGASVQRSGFIIYVSDGSGHAVSKIVAISSMGVEPHSSSGAPEIVKMSTTFGEPVNDLQWETKPAWGGSPFTTTGTAITAWLKNSQPMLIFSGTTLPIEVMPTAMQKIVSFFPLTQGLTMMKNTFLGISTGSVLLPIFVMVGVATLCAGFAARFLRWE